MRFPTPLIVSGLVLLLSASPFASVATAQSQTIPGLFDTGVDSGGVQLPIGTSDPHYTLSGWSNNATAILTNAAWTWVTGGYWIGPPGAGASGAPSGNYNYETTFDMTGLDPGNAQVDFWYAADDDVSLFFNGAFLGWAGYPNYAQVSLTTGFVPGINTIEFKVVNSTWTSWNPTGLVVGGMTGTAMSTGPAISVSGTCGLAGSSVEMVNGTPNSPCALVWGFASGTTVIAAAPACIGTVLDIDSAVLAAVVTSDANGDASFQGGSGMIPAAACGAVVIQGLDAATCVATNMLTL